MSKPAPAAVASSDILILPFGHRPYLSDVIVAAAVGLLLPIFVALKANELAYLPAWLALAAVAALKVLAYGWETWLRPSMAVLDMVTGQLSLVALRRKLQYKAVPNFQMQHFDEIGFAKSDSFHRTGLYDVIASAEYDVGEYLAQQVPRETAENVCKIVAERFSLENKGYLGS